MLRKLLLGVVVCCSCLSLELAKGAAPPAAACIPEESVLTVEVTQIGELLDRATDPSVLQKIRAVPQVQNGLNSPGFRQFVAAVRYIETMLNTDWQSAIRQLFGGGATLAVGPSGGVLLVVDSSDEQLLKRLHDVLVGFAKGNAEKKGQPDKPLSQDHQGVAVWSFGANESHAIIGSRFLLSNRRDVLTAALDLMAQPDGKSLQKSPRYASARQASATDAAARVFVDLAEVKQNPRLKAAQKALAQSRNPMAALVLGGVLDAIQQADWLTAGLTIDGSTVKLTTSVPEPRGDASDSLSFARPDNREQGAWPNLDVPGRIAAVSLYRDLRTFYAAKDELFPERTSGLIFFENMMGIFFTGRNLTEEVLAQTLPEVRLVVSRQQYDPAIGTPEPQIPAFAAIFHLREPEGFALVAEEAWQKALGLVNFTRGQQALPGLIIDRFTHSGTKFSMAYFSPADIEDRNHLDMRFNFRPSIAVVGEYLILSSTDGLTRDLIDSLNQEKTRRGTPLAMTDTCVEIDGTEIAAILGHNRNALIRQNMVEKGHVEEQAKREIGILLALANHLGSSRLEIGRGKGHYRAELAIDVNLDAPLAFPEAAQR